MGNKNSALTAEKLEIVLKRSLIRLELLTNKKTSALANFQTQAFELYQAGKLNLARIKVQNVIFAENMIQVLRNLQGIIEKIITLSKEIENSRPCMKDIKENICSLIYCSGRCECEELL